MNTDPLETLWRSDANGPAAAEMERQRGLLASGIARRTRRFALAMSAAALGLACLTTALLMALSGDESIKGAEASGLVGLLLLPWVALALFVRRRRKLHDQHPDYSRSTADILRALVAETRFARARVRTIALLHAISLPLLGGAVYQLWSGGRATASEAASLATVLTALLTTTGGVLAYRYFGQLGPRERALQEVLATYEG
jgi:Na+/proline symporter